MSDAGSPRKWTGSSAAFTWAPPLVAWLTRRVFESAWLRRRRTSRALSVTDLDRGGLRGLRMSWEALSH